MYVICYDLSGSGKLKEILVSTNDHCVCQKFTYDIWSRNFIHMYSLSPYVSNTERINWYSQRIAF